MTTVSLDYDVLRNHQSILYLLVLNMQFHPDEVVFSGEGF